MTAKMAKYPYRCPKCGRQYELRVRETVTRRRCPHCAVEITSQEIDLQQAERQATDQLKTLARIAYLIVLFFVVPFVAMILYMALKLDFCPFRGPLNERLA
jgi:DNA-directed RNA polymerase subunit RPC12/RpoP